VSLRVSVDGGLSTREWDCKTVLIGERWYPCYMVCPLCGQPTLAKSYEQNIERHDLYVMVCTSCGGGTPDMVRLRRNRPKRVRHGRGWSWSGIRSEARTVGILKRFMVPKAELAALRLGREVARELMEGDG